MKLAITINRFGKFVASYQPLSGDAGGRYQGGTAIFGDLHAAAAWLGINYADAVALVTPNGPVKDSPSPLRILDQKLVNL